MSHTITWDGIEFQELDVAEAEALVKADKAQIIEGTVGAFDLKYRHEFTGYNPQPEPVATKSEEPDPMSKAIPQGKMKSWQTYKKIVADELDKPANKVTKSDVEKYLKGSA